MLRSLIAYGPSRLTFWTLCGLALSGSLPAAPTLIDDSGHTAPLTPYVEPLTGAGPETAPPLTEPPPVARPLTLEDRLPVRTPELSPGPLTARPDPALAERLQLLPRPFFLIGADPLSRQWLAVHRETLRQLNAVGLLVQADTPEEVEAIARLGAGLIITLASGSELARALHLTHYPVLVSPAGIEQ